MFYVINWFVVVALLALWSLAAWALHAATVWAVSNAGALSDAGSLNLPDWLAPWVPSELAQALSQLVAGLDPLVESWLQAAPTLAGSLTVAAWVIWGIGSALLLLGAGLHLLIALWRRRDGGSGPRSGRSLAAN